MVSLPQHSSETACSNNTGTHRPIKMPCRSAQAFASTDNSPLNYQSVISGETGSRRRPRACNALFSRQAIRDILIKFSWDDQAKGFGARAKRAGHSIVQCAMQN
jgi:hypothetical protein